MIDPDDSAGFLTAHALVYEIKIGAPFPMQGIATRGTRLLRLSNSIATLNCRVLRRPMEPKRWLAGRRHPVSSCGRTGETARRVGVDHPLFASLSETQ